MLTTDSNQLGFKRDIGDPEITYSGDINLSSLSTLGLQANYKFSDKWQFIGQVLLRDHPKQNADNIVRLASLVYDPLPEWQIRLGRIPQGIFTFSESRPIGYTHPWALPPQELYSLFTFNYIDGMDTTYTVPVGEGYLHANAAYGENTIYLISGSELTSNFGVDDVYELNLSFDWNAWQTRLSWARSTATSSWDQIDQLRGALNLFGSQLMWQQGIELANDLDITNDVFRYLSASFAYDDGDISMLTEYGILKSNSITIPTINTGYFSVGKTFDWFTPYVVIGHVQSDRRKTEELSPPILTPELQELISVTSTFLSIGFDQTSISFGTRLNLGTKQSLKIQWDHKRVKDNGFGLWTPDENSRYPSGDVTVNVISARFDFIF